MKCSPSELFLGRLTKTKLPINPEKLVRACLDEKIVQKKISDKKVKQKEYFDRKTRKLSTLNTGDKVMFKKEASNWVYGEIVEAVNDRSYLIKSCAGKIFRRNRRLIVKTNNTAEEDTDPYDFFDDQDDNILVEGQQPDETQRNLPQQDISIENPPLATAASNQTTTRYGRIIRPPNRYGNWA